MRPHKLVTIARFQGISTASLARNRLEEAGIPSFLADAETITTDWLLSNAMGGVKLQVEAGDADRAREELANDMDAESIEALNREAVESGDEDTEPDAADPDEPVAELSDREETAQRAWRGSLLSLAFPPMYYLILWMLGKVYFSEQPLGEAYRRKAWYAAILTIPVVVLLTSALLLLLSELLSYMH